jgi:2-iminobutanoate/2-iminopropanoate deaminase
MTAGLRYGWRYGCMGLLGLAAACAPAAGQRARTGTPPDLQEAEHINTPSVQSLDGFSQAVRAGTSLYVSDQVALDSAGTLVGGADLRLQLDQALRNLSAVLRAGRALPADVVQVTVYVVDYRPADYATIRDAITAFTPPGRPPALTLVGVTALPVSGLRVAIDAVAHVRGLFLDRDRLPGGPLSPDR